MASIFELELLFLKVLKTSWIYPIKSKVCFVKWLANSKWHMFLTWSTYVLTISPFGNPWQNHTNKWTYERSHKSLNSYSLVEYNKIYPNTNSWKTLQEEISWHGRLWQPMFLKYIKHNLLRHLSVKQKYKRLHTINKKHVHKERKETIHGEIGERM